MDLITTGVSASERMRRENMVSSTRNIIMEKMQLGGPSMRLLEVHYILDAAIFLLLFSVNHNQYLNVLNPQILEELKKLIPGSEVHLHDVSYLLPFLLHSLGLSRI